MSALGRSKTAAYNVALREMDESRAALDVSLRLGYLPALGTARVLRAAHRRSPPARLAARRLLP